MSGDAGGGLRLWRAADGEPLCSRPCAHSGAVICLAFLRPLQVQDVVVVFPSSKEDIQTRCPLLQHRPRELLLTQSCFKGKEISPFSHLENKAPRLIKYVSTVW